MKRKILAALLASVTLSISFSGFSSYAYYDVSQENKNLKDQSGMLRITEGGTYILQGKMSGGVFVDAGNEDVELILDGVYIDGKEGAGIVALSGNKLRITLPEGSVNKVTDGGQDSFYNAAIFSAIDTVFRGDDDSDVEIKSSGTYVVTGSSSDGNITVKKGTSGVVLVLDDLDLTSTTGATVSINKEAEVKVIISGTVTLTDNENPDDENSTDEAVADAFDGAALKAKADSTVYVTGNGTLTINGNAKNGIKGGDNSSLIFDGITMNITAANDGINSNYDVTLLSGKYTISAEDDAIHADHILTIGAKDGSGPDVTVSKSNEGLEGTVVNMYGGKVSVTSTDDAVNAANGDGIYEGVLDYSFNMMGGSLEINSQGDGIDSNGNVNLLGGSARINSASTGGEAGIDYDGQLYVDDSFNLNNQSSVSGPDAAFGAPGEMNGQQGQMQQSFDPEQQSDRQQQSFTPDQQSDQLQQGFAFDQDPTQMQSQNSGPADMSFSQPMNDDFGHGPDDQGPSGDMPLLR